MSLAKRAIGNCLLAFASLAVGLALCEATLRLFHPRYEYAAAPPQRTYHWSSQYRHPDTGEPHLVVYNNLGSRQHRDFHERELAEGVNLAFFGDSFTENLRMAAQFSFTEVLDYVLNAQPRRGPSSSPADTALRAGRFNVLNFGMDARGPVEQYWRYRGLGFKRLLRHVFYVHSLADIHRLRGWRGGGRLAGQARQSRTSRTRRSLDLGPLTSGPSSHLFGFGRLASDRWQRPGVRVLRCHVQAYGGGGDSLRASPRRAPSGPSTSAQIQQNSLS